MLVKNKRKYIFVMMLLSLYLVITVICIFFPSIIIKKFNVDTVAKWNDLSIIGGGYHIQENMFTASGNDAGFILPLKKDCSEIEIELSSIQKVKAKNKILNIQFYYPDNKGEYSSKRLITTDVLYDNTSVKFSYDGKAGTSIRIDIGNLKGDKFSLKKITLYDYILKIEAIDCLCILLCFLFILTLISIVYKFFLATNHNRITIYLVLILGGCIIYWIVCFVTRGDYFGSVFIQDNRDTFMDYFHSLKNANYDPYKDRNSNYPALACLFYKILAHSIPLNVRTQNAFEIRNSRDALLIFSVYTCVTIWAIQAMILYKSKLTAFQKRLLSLAVLLSAPFLFTLERGNLILLVFTFTLFFCLFYDSENKYIREISYIALAVAVSMKIYPAIFGLLLLKRNRYKESIRLTLYGMFVFIFPFFFYEGFNSILKMFSALSETSNWERGYGVNFSLYNITKMFGKIFNCTLSDGTIYFLYFIVVFMLLTSFISLKEHWKGCLSLTLLLILIPKISYSYSTIFILIPFYLFLNNIYINHKNEMTKLNFYDLSYAIAFSIILIPWPMRNIPMLSDGVPLTVSYGMLLQYFAMLWLMLIITLDCISNFITNDNLLQKAKYIITIIFSILITTTLLLTILP